MGRRHGRKWQAENQRRQTGKLYSHAAQTLAPSPTMLYAMGSCPASLRSGRRGTGRCCASWRGRKS